MAETSIPSELAEAVQQSLDERPGVPILLAPVVRSFAFCTADGGERTRAVWTILAEHEGRALSGAIFTNYTVEESAQWLLEHGPILIATKTHAIPAVGKAVGGTLVFARLGREYDETVAMFSGLIAEFVDRDEPRPALYFTSQ